VFVLSNPSILAQTQNGLFEYSTTWKNLTYYELNKGQLFQNPKKPEQLVFISSAMYISNNAGRGFSFLDRRNIRIFQAAFPQMLTLKVAWYTPFFTTIMKVNIIPVK